MRFAPPVYKDTLNNETFDASVYGLPCPQLGVGTLRINNTFQVLKSFQIDNGTEDCLKLNILRPAETNISEPLPVMVWIFGGGFKSGFADKFNGSTLVAQSVNRVYRLFPDLYAVECTNPTIGHTYDLCQLQLPRRAMGLSTRV